MNANLKKFIDDLNNRKILNNISNKDKFLNLSQCGVYIGFDPTAQSLHLGNYVQIATLKRFQSLNFKCFAILGGATGMIGDPSGKVNERSLLSQEAISKNQKKIAKQLNFFNLKVLNNYDFYKSMNVLDFFRDIGKLLNINYMLSKEVVKSRIETGISFTEFSYQLIQGWDFKTLFEEHGINVQIGGSDQWGNITSGLEIIRKCFGEDALAVGITTNLLTKSDGSKFGKTADGALWLDKTMTSPFELYQYLLNQPDEDIEKLLLWLTFISVEDIEKLCKKHRVEPWKKLAQKELAKQLTIDIHSEEDYQKSKKLTKILFEDYDSDLLKEVDLIEAKYFLKHVFIKDINVVDALLKLGAATSRREAKELILNKAIRINNDVTTDLNFNISLDKKFNKNVTIIKKGKRYNYLVIHQ